MPIDRLPVMRLAGWPLLALAISLAILLQAAAARSSVIAKDGIGFIRIAQRLQADPAAAMTLEDQHPGYPAMILAGRYLLPCLGGLDDFSAWIIAARFAAAACGAMTILLIWLVARRLYDQRVAGVSALLAAVWPLLRQNGADTLSDTPHLMFYLAAAWLVCEGLCRRSLVWFAAAGTASGLAYWVRPEGLLVGLVAGGVLLGLCLTRRPFRRPLPDLAVLAICTLAVALPYTATAGKLTSKKNPFRPLAAAGAAVAAPSAVSPLPANPADNSLPPTAGLVLEPAPGQPLPDEIPRPSSRLGIAAAGVAELCKELAQGFRYLLLLLLAVGNMAPGRVRRQMLPAVFIWSLLAAHALLLIALYCLSGYISHRHVIPLIALCIPTTAAGVVYGVDRLQALAPVRPWCPWIARIAVASLVAFMAPICARPLHQIYQPLVDAARWVKADARPGDTVLTTSNYTRFYGSMGGLLLSIETPDLATGLTQAPHQGVWPYLVLEVDARAFDPSSLQINRRLYHQVASFGGCPKRPWAKVLVFRGRNAAAPMAGPPANRCQPPGAAQRDPLRR